MPSRAFYWLHAFPRLVLATCFPALVTGYMLSRVFCRLHAYPRFWLAYCAICGRSDSFFDYFCFSTAVAQPLCTKIKMNLTLLTRWLCHGAPDDSVLSSSLFSASGRNFSECESRLSKYGYQAEINKNTRWPVTMSVGITMRSAIVDQWWINGGPMLDQWRANSLRASNQWWTTVAH